MMKTNTVSATGANFLVVALGILVALLVFAVLTGRKIPLLTNERAALLALVVIGMAMCSNGGIGQVAARGLFWHPLSIAGYLMGATILAIGIAALFGRNIPPLTSYHQSFLAVSVIALVKIVFTTLHRLLS
jgi:hypothetical protein